MKRRLTNNLLLKIASVVFAVVVWLIVLNINDPNKTVKVSGIPVELKNTETITSQDKAFEIESGANASITISGPRSIVDKLEAEDFIATADVNDLSLTNAIPVVVELRKNTYKSKVDITVNTTIRLSIEDVIEKEFEIEPEYTGSTAIDYAVVNTKLGKNTVKITAPRSTMARIKKVTAVINIEGKNDDFSCSAPLKLKDIDERIIDIANNDIKLSFAETKAKLTVYYVKEIPIQYNVPEQIDYDNMVAEHSVSSTSIKISGRKEMLDTITALILPVDVNKINVAEIENKLLYNVNDFLPEGVYLYSGEEEIALKIILDRQNNKTFEMSVSNISISNIPEGYEASFITKGNVSYVVRGTAELVESFVPDITSIHVSMEGLGEGEHSLPVNVTLPEGITMVEKAVVEVSLKLIEEDEDNSQNNNNDSQSNGNGENNNSDSDNNNNSGDNTGNDDNNQDPDNSGNNNQNDNNTNQDEELPEDDSVEGDAPVTPEPENPSDSENDNTEDETTGNQEETTGQGDEEVVN